MAQLVVDTGVGLRSKVKGPGAARMWFENVGSFIEFGFEHILPKGLDHVLFVAALYLNARSWPSLILQVTTFTVAHTITLALAAASVAPAPGEIIEPLISFSIAVLAVEAILFPRGAAWRLPVVFAFGLLHGLGFGSAMAPALQTADFSAGMVGITVGVELGHLSVLVATAALALSAQLVLKAVKRPQLYRPAFVYPVAGVIALIGLYWTLQRTHLIPGA